MKTTVSSWIGRFDPDGCFHPQQGMEAWNDFLEKREEGRAPLSISVRHFKQRSGRQNDRYWGVIIPAVLEHHNKIRKEQELFELDKDQMHAILKRAFLNTDNLEWIAINDRQFYIEPSTKTLSKKEFMDYCDEIQGYYAGLGVVFKDDPE